MDRRGWTGQEADFVRLEEGVVLHMSGREYLVPLARLSETDKDVARKLGAEAAEAARSGPILIEGQEVSRGKTTSVSIDFSPDEIKLLSREDRGGGSGAIGTSLAAGLRPDTATERPGRPPDDEQRREIERKRPINAIYHFAGPVW